MTYLTVISSTTAQLGTCPASHATNVSMVVLQCRADKIEMSLFAWAISHILRCATLRFAVLTYIVPYNVVPYYCQLP